VRRKDHQAAQCAAMIPAQEEIFGEEVLGHTHNIIYIFVTRSAI